ncbi:MAG: hypothetical protein M3O46_17325 [Myxococcota bacterium]|nr:hypothetical protein [Myxococcota bacterium]
MKKAFIFLAASCSVTVAVACSDSSTPSNDAGNDGSSSSSSSGSSSGARSDSGSGSGGGSGSSSGSMSDAGPQCASKAQCTGTQVCCAVFGGGMGSSVCQAAPCTSPITGFPPIQLCATSAECATGACLPAPAYIATFLPMGVTIMFCQAVPDAGGADGSSGGDASGMGDAADAGDAATQDSSSGMDSAGDAPVDTGGDRGGDSGPQDAAGDGG